MNQRRILIIGAILSIILLLLLVIVYITNRQRQEDNAQQQDQTPRQEVPIPTTSDVDFTQPPSQEALNRIEESHRIFAPTVYVMNKLPHDEVTYAMDFYLDEEREAYVFTVEPKISSLQQVQQDVLDWLLGIGLTEDQIGTLIIEYTTEVN